MMIRAYLRQHWKKTLMLLLIFFFLYLFLGTVLPYIWQKEVSSMTSADIDVTSFYGEQEDRVQVRYITDNTDALQYRLYMVDRAREEILFSTFDFNDDEGGKDMMSAMLQAADRGVSVKIVVDGISAALDFTGSHSFKALAAHPNVRIKVYNPINIIKPWAWQVRLHDKYIVVDDTMYLLGGRNTTDLFLGDYKASQNFDGDLFVYRDPGSTDQSLTALQEYFGAIWALDCCKDYTYDKENRKVDQASEALMARYDRLKEMYPAAFQEPDWETETISVRKISLLYNPIEAKRKEPLIWFQLHQLMLTGQDVVMHTPYIICNKSMYRDLTDLTDQGTRFSLIINDPNTGANPFGTSDYRMEKKKVLATGARVFEYAGAQSSHTKAILIDERLSIVGSFNLDMRSVYLDTELMLVVDGEALNTQLRDYTDDVLSKSKELLPDQSYALGNQYQEPDTGTFQRGLSKALGVLIRPFRFLL